MASVISGSAIFTIEDHLGNFYGSGSFVLARNHVVDFELIVGDAIYDEADIGYHCNCSIITQPEIYSVGFAFSDDGIGDFWIMTFSFHDAVFGFVYDAGDTFIRATADNGISSPGNFNLRAHVPEPGSLVCG